MPGHSCVVDVIVLANMNDAWQLTMQYAIILL